MQNSNTHKVTLLRANISGAVRQDEHITWPVIDAKKRSELKDLESLAARLQRKMGDQVRLQALEQTDGKRVESILVAIFGHPELPFGSSGADAILQQFRDASQVVRQVAASSLPAELISISSGDPEQSSESNIRAPKEIAELAAVLRTHLPASGVEVDPDSPTSFSFVPKRGSSEILLDSRDLELSGEVLAVNDKARTMLLRGPDGQCTQLHIPRSGHFRERLLDAQLHRKSVELRVTPSYQIENGTRRMRGGTLQEILRTIDVPVQGSLVD
ncbi:MAG: hypothetical protein CVV07_10070 [Gammaproteobacteria bacterium HGW-Gammaproteobacteria-11]|nr:MAG: hypothetical protein CVV07_10070 [Gammaproteobacteria bacterium HGW-Gammaproteobacteria-11]